MSSQVIEMSLLCVLQCFGKYFTSQNIPHLYLNCADLIVKPGQPRNDIDFDMNLTKLLGGKTLQQKINGE